MGSLDEEPRMESLIDTSTAVTSPERKGETTEVESVFGTKNESEKDSNKDCTQEGVQNVESATSQSSQPAKVFPCGICSKTYPYKYSLTRHERTHVISQPVNCSSCIIKHSLPQSPNIKDETQVCSTCGIQFTMTSLFENPQNILNCTSCPMSFPQLDLLTDHVKTHEDQKPLVCTVCKKIFSDPHLLSSHKCLRGSRKKSSSCLCCEVPSSKHTQEPVGNTNHECNVESKVSTEINLPSNTIKSDENSYHCDICNNIYSRKVYLSRHKRRMHGYYVKPQKILNPDEQSYECNICNNVFKKRRYLSKHQKRMHGYIESGNSQHNTALYETDSIKKEKLPTNIQVETLKCTICDKPFLKPAYLYKHMRQLHDEEKPSENYSEATAPPKCREQTNENLRTCKPCNKVFTRKYSLHMHKLRFHSNKKHQKFDQQKDELTSNQDLYKYKKVLLETNIKKTKKNINKTKKIFSLPVSGKSLKAKFLMLKAGKLSKGKVSFPKSDKVPKEKLALPKSGKIFKEKLSLQTAGELPEEKQSLPKLHELLKEKQSLPKPGILPKEKQSLLKPGILPKEKQSLQKPSKLPKEKQSVSKACESRKRKKLGRPPKENSEKPIRKYKKAVSLPLTSSLLKPIDKKIDFSEMTNDFSDNTLLPIKLENLLNPNFSFTETYPPSINFSPQITKVDISEDIYRCYICGKIFDDYDTLVQHKFIHRSDEIFECRDCGKTFAHSSTLSRHRVVHRVSEKPFGCNLCGRTFTQRYSLTIHKRYHTGEKPYQCQKCGKAFSVKNSLTMHIKRPCKIGRKEKKTL